MSNNRRHRSAEFKFQVALEAAKGLKSVSQLANQYEVHPNQISKWKQELLKGGAGLFAQRSVRQEREQEALQVALYEQIGRLQMELEWVKKKASRVS